MSENVAGAFGRQGRRKRVNRYRDLQEQGYGERTTVYRKVRAGKFPAPFEGPIWFDWQLDEHDASLERANWAPQPEELLAED